MKRYCPNQLGTVNTRMNGGIAVFGELSTGATTEFTMGVSGLAR